MIPFWYIPFTAEFIPPPPTEPPVIGPPHEEAILSIGKINVIAMSNTIGKEISKLPPRNPTTTEWTRCSSPNTEVFEIAVDVTVDFEPRDFVKVNVGNKIYEEVGTLQACHATDQSWFHNRAGTGKLYINPEGTGVTEIDLDTKIVMAWFPMNFANIGTFLEDKWYEPRLILQNNQFQSKVGVTDRLFINPYLSSGNIEMWNGDGFFDELFFDYEWLTAETELRHGAITTGALDTTNTVVVRKTFINGYSREDLKAKFSFAQISNRTEVKALKMIFTRTEDTNRPWNPHYENLPDTEEGKNQPIVFGEFDDVSGTKLERSYRAVEAICIDPATAHETSADSGLFRQRVYKWMAELTDPETNIKYGGDVVAVLRQDSQDVNKIKIVNIGTSVVLSENNTRLDFDNSYEIAEGDRIWVLGNGYRDKTEDECTDLGIDTAYAYRFTGIEGGVIKEPQDAAHFCLVMLAGIRTAEIDIASFTKVGIQKPDETMTLVDGTMEPPSWFGEVKHYERADVSVTSLINLWCVGLRALVSQGFSGKLELGLISSDPSTFTNTTPVLSDVDYGSWTETRGVDSLISTLAVEYSINFNEESRISDQSHKRHKKRKKRKQEPVTPIGPVIVEDEYARALGIEKEITIRTALADEAVALLVANSYFHSFKRGVIVVDTSEVLGLLLEHQPGRPVLLIRNRAIGGSYYEKGFLPQEFGRSYGGGTSMKLMEGL